MEDLNFDIRLSSDKVISTVDIPFSNNLLTKKSKGTYDHPYHGSVSGIHGH